MNNKMIHRISTFVTQFALVAAVFAMTQACFLVFYQPELQLDAFEAKHD